MLSNIGLILIEYDIASTQKIFSLFHAIQKYLNPLKLPEYSSLIDTQTVDEIFLMVPAILDIHKRFLDELRKRLDAWEPLQKVGDAFVEVVSVSSANIVLFYYSRYAS